MPLRRLVGFMLAATLLASPALAADKFKAVTTFTVLADMAREVAGDAAIVESITKPGAEIHGYSPTPRDILKAQDADLVLWNGLNLELWFEQFFQNLRDVPSAILTDGITPIDIASGDYRGKPNPHAWMGLDNALVYIDNIREAFSEHDPATPRPTRPMRRPTSRGCGKPSSRCGRASRPCRKTAAGSSPARARSATLRRTSA